MALERTLETWADAHLATAAWIEAGGAVLTVVVATVAAFYAARQVRVARQDRDDRSRPFVTVTLRPSHGVVANIVIRNEGVTMARNVRFVFTPEWESTDPRRTAIRESRIWRDGIPNLAPGQEFAIFADTFPERKKSDLPRVYDVHVSCDGKPTRWRRPTRIEEHYVLDFDVFYGFSTATVYDVHDVANALRGVKATLDRWSEGAAGPLSVLVRDGHRRDEDEARAHEAWLERRAADKRLETGGPGNEVDLALESAGTFEQGAGCDLLPASDSKSEPVPVPVAESEEIVVAEVTPSPDAWEVPGPALTPEDDSTTDLGPEDEQPGSEEELRDVLTVRDYSTRFNAQQPLVRPPLVQRPLAQEDGGSSDPAPATP